MVVLPEEYKKDNFYKLYDEINKEAYVLIIKF